MDLIKAGEQAGGNSATPEHPAVVDTGSQKDMNTADPAVISPWPSSPSASTAARLQAQVQPTRRPRANSAANWANSEYGSSMAEDASGSWAWLQDAALAAGGQVIGVIPDHLQLRERGHHGVTELRVVGSMHERKNVMFELSDAFIILPGGYGTLDEAFEMLTWRQLRLHDKPVLFANIDAYWDPLKALIDHFIHEGFAQESSRRLFTFVDKIEGILPTLMRQPMPAIAEDRARL